MLKQNLSLKLSQKLSPRQIQLMKLIQLPTLDFEQKLKQEIEENPALEFDENQLKEEYENQEEDFDQEGNQSIEADINVDEYLSDDEIPSYRLQVNNYSPDQEYKEIPYAQGDSFHQLLVQQLSTCMLDEQQMRIGVFLVGSIDQSGYLRRSLDDIVDDLAFTQSIITDADELEKLLKVIQTFDPVGVGARNLQECLLIQLRRKKPSSSIDLAIGILDNFFESFTKKHYKKLIQRLSITEQQLKEAISEIESLNPKPGGSQGSDYRFVEPVVPDFTVRIEDGGLILNLNNRNVPELQVSRNYKDLLLGYKDAEKKSKAQRDTVTFIKQKLDSAKWFIEAIKQRQDTLLTTMNEIVKYQTAYFMSGDDRDLKPMILKDIADRIDMDISTVSRVANSKYVDTPYGVKKIKEFFSESMTNDKGEEVSTKEIKKILQLTIQSEDKKKPLTDEKLVGILKDKGYPIARRTIAKYREQLGIPVARLRKKI